MEGGREGPKEGVRRSLGPRLEFNANVNCLREARGEQAKQHFKSNCQPREAYCRCASAGGPSHRVSPSRSIIYN